jgi:polyhydroxybutyrate depolymerase
MKNTIYAIAIIIISINTYAKTTSHYVSIAGSSDTVNIHSPDSVNPAKKLPVIINLHGYTGSPFKQHFVMPFKHHVNSEEFILVNPAGIKDDKGNSYWSAENCCGEVEHIENRRDDVAFINSIIDKIIDNYNVDATKIFIAGHSNGGFMANKLACDPDSRVSGIVNLGGAGYSKPENCKAPRPIKVLHIHGNKDDTIKYSGSEWHPGAKHSALQWVQRNNCTSRSQTKKLSNKTVFFRKIETQTWNQCSRDSKVSLWTIIRGGHYELMTSKLTKKIINFLFLK